MLYNLCNSSCIYIYLFFSTQNDVFVTVSYMLASVSVY